MFFYRYSCVEGSIVTMRTILLNPLKINKMHYDDERAQEKFETFPNGKDKVSNKKNETMDKEENGLNGSTA